MTDIRLMLHVTRVHAPRVAIVKVENTMCPLNKPWVL